MFAWGDGSSGRLGLGTEHDALVPTRIDTFAPNTMLDIAKVGSRHAFCFPVTRSLLRIPCRLLKLTSPLSHACPPCSLPPFHPTLSPCPFSQFNIVSVSAGQDNSAAITSRGDLYTWGFSGTDCKLGHGDEDSEWEPRLVQVKGPAGLPPKFVSVSLGARCVGVPVLAPAALHPAAVHGSCRASQGRGGGHLPPAP